MKLDQIAFYAHNDEQSETIKRTFNIQGEWALDHVAGSVRLPQRGIYDYNKAFLQFNEHFGIQYEIIRYEYGPHWHDQNEDFLAGRPFLCHVGFHLDENEDFPILPNCPLVQEMHTMEHTNPFLMNERKFYHYMIFDTRAVNGTYSKYIRRIVK